MRPPTLSKTATVLTALLTLSLVSAVHKRQEDPSGTTTIPADDNATPIPSDATPIADTVSPTATDDATASGDATAAPTVTAPPAASWDDAVVVVEEEDDPDCTTKKPVSWAPANWTAPDEGPKNGVAPAAAATDAWTDAAPPKPVAPYTGGATRLAGRKAAAGAAVGLGGLVFGVAAVF